MREQVRQLRDVGARQKRLENLLVSAYHALPQANHLDTIPGVGAVTAAVLTAFILDIDRFETPNKLVAYFGVLPHRSGQRRRPRRPGAFAATLRHEPTRQRPGATLSVDGRPERHSLQSGRAGVVRAGRRQASRPQGDRRRPRHA